MDKTNDVERLYDKEGNYEQRLILQERHSSITNMMNSL